MPTDDPDNPAHLRGSADPSPGDTSNFLYSYPFLLNTKLGRIKNKALFGTRRAIVLEGEEYDPSRRRRALREH